MDKAVVAGMPQGEDEEVDVYLFHLNRVVSDAELSQEYESCELKPDPVAQIQVNVDESAFADEHPNGCHWKDADENWCFEAFSRRYNRRRVDVRRSLSDWNVYWWFAGVPK